jgi:hypothetical protein
VEIRIGRLRADSASYQAGVINACQERGIRFVIGADLDAAVRAAVTMISTLPGGPGRPHRLHDPHHEQNSHRLSADRGEKTNPALSAGSSGGIPGPRNPVKGAGDESQRDPPMGGGLVQPARRRLRTLPVRVACKINFGFWAWRKALKRAGISDFRWHDLRHTWASWHVQVGTPLHVLQELVGWSDFKMVQRYAHMAPEHLSRFVENSKHVPNTSQARLKIV